MDVHGSTKLDHNSNRISFNCALCVAGVEIQEYHEPVAELVSQNWLEISVSHVLYSEGTLFQHFVWQSFVVGRIETVNCICLYKSINQSR